MSGFNFTGGKYDRDNLPKINAVDIAEILKQSRERFVLNTTKGTVVLKHMTKRTKDRLDAIKYTVFPDAEELEEEASVLLPMATAEGCDPDVKMRAQKIAVQLAPIMDIYALGCVEYPFLTTIDDLDVFLQSLQPDEKEAIRQMLTILTDWSAPVDFTKLTIAERFGLKLIQMEHIEDPTYMQFLALKSVIESERAETEKAYRKAGIL